MATIKISDLSVGDWVMCNEDKYRVMGITMFHELDLLKSSESFRTSIDNIHPIPITAEILEKNGFERLLERDLFYHSEAGLEVVFEDGEWMHTINLHEYTIHTISGVHHIQHLLRFCGCEKEINL